MMDFLTGVIAWINMLANSLGWLLAPIAVLPGWLSNTIISAVTGVLLLLIFKYTSNQLAIGRVRNEIKANMLALKLFKDSVSVTLKAQGHIFGGSLRLLFYAIRPMLVMILPVILLLAQMGLWYQARPLRTGEQAIITMKLNGDIDTAWPQVDIKSTPAAKVITGPVRAFNTREICWEIEAQQNGSHNIVFQVDHQQIEKELAIGPGFMRVSTKRPGWHWTDVLMHPWEKPFRPDSIVNSITITYPDRISINSGTDWWVIYFFIASMVFAMIFKPFLKVKI
jgi:uncharacterized membrane protein (DUF106 family)